MRSPSNRTPAGRTALAWTGALVALFALALWSLSVGVSDVSWGTLWSDSDDDMVAQVLMYSRVPRTLALMLAGAGALYFGALWLSGVRIRTLLRR